jgi:galactokinase
VIAGDVPIGSGLSSSAAVEVASALAFLSLLEPEERRDLTGPELARLCQRAENDFVGLDCGIMDQFTSVLARAGRALFLDCRNLEFHHLLLDTAAYGFIVADSGKSRELASSAYNERRRQCQQAVAILAAGRPEIHSLRDVPPQELARRQQELPPVIHRRARHVVEEIARTLQAREALERGDYAEFGRLMNQSHESLRDLYEVSSAELDRLVEIARSCRGVLGSRLTGAGFGGCTVTLAEAGAAAEVMGELRRSCQRDAGLPPALFFTTPVAGARASRLAEVAG